MKVLFVPFQGESSPNPYQTLLATALSAQDVEVVGSLIFPKISWLWKNRGDVKIIHIHWPSHIYNMGNRTWIRLLIVLTRFFYARISGYKIIWTVHNLLPHETISPWMDNLFRRVLVRFGHGIIGHCNYALEQVGVMFGVPVRSAIIPHGNYDGYYPPLIPKKDARLSLNLQPANFVFLCFGIVRYYKGILKLLSQFKLLEGNVTLVVAGKIVQSELSDIKILIGNSDVRIFDYFIPEDEVPLFFSAADALVLPYANILTSGSAALGLTFGLPVVAPKIGCLPSQVPDDCGILYDNNDEFGLLKALEAIQARDLRNMSKSARRYANGMGWDVLGVATANFYKQCME